jgi:hypothetical protein
MYRRSFFAAIIALALVSMACGLRIGLPVRNIRTGPTRTEAINVAVPAGGTANLTLEFGAGRLQLRPGAEEGLVTGTATYNVDDFKPIITTDGDRVKIESGDLEITGIPNFTRDVKNEWELQLGDSPMNLTIGAGAYEGRYDLGGLSLESIEITDGAADVELDFSEPNKVEMSNLRYQTGASNVELTNLGNANFESMIFKSGAGQYTLDFSGELSRNADISVESGISEVTIIVPEGVSASLTFEGGLSNVDAEDNWQRSGNTYTLDGSGPTLTFEVTMGAGNLRLRNN